MLSVMLLTVVVVFLVTGRLEAVTFPKSKPSDSQEFDVCLRSDDPLLPCLTSGAVKTLVAANNLNELDLGDGLALVQDNSDDGIPNTLTGDPREARTLLESVGLFMEQRYLHWDLSELFPGLVMRVGPSARGMLQFLLDKRRIVDDRSLTTGGLLMKRTILPVLLGVKLNISTLIPLLFAGLIILIKKALILSKFSVLLSGLAFFFRRGMMMSHRPGTVGSVSSSGSVFGGGSFGGGGLGSFGDPPKHIIVDRQPPFDHHNVWFARENPE